MMADNFCVVINHCRDNGELATVGFVVANAALGSEKDTIVFLSADGVWCAVTGEAEKIDEGPPFAPLKELINKFVSNGGKILICTPCLKTRGIVDKQLIGGASPAGGATLVEWLSEGGSCVSF